MTGGSESVSDCANTTSTQSFVARNVPVGKVLGADIAKLPSPASTVSGVVAAGFQRLLQGHDAPATLTVTPLPGVSMFPLSSIARLRIVIAPATAGDQS